MSDAMTAWIKDHGAEWVTKINDETRDAMRAMIEASTKGQFTVDELSRAIRPAYRSDRAPGGRKPEILRQRKEKSSRQRREGGCGHKEGPGAGL